MKRSDLLISNDLPNALFFFFFFGVFINPDAIYAQCTAGIVTSAHSSTIYDALLDPDGDGYISESGGAFTSDTTEMAEFENIANSVTSWVAIQDVSETNADITPNCGNSDLVSDNNGGDFAFYNIIDPTPGTPSNGDEYILFRFRLAKSPNGNFGYNFLIDTDLIYGGGSDGNSTCGNMGFEREVQFANAGGNKGVSVYDVDGNTAFNSTLCDQCVGVNDVQEACAASSGGCATSDPQFITFPLPLSHIGVGSNVATADFYISVATASSGNGTSVLGGGNVTDMGALDGTNTGCSCASLSGCALFDCQTDCVNLAFTTSLPVELLYFEAINTTERVQLEWATATEVNNSHFEIEHSVDGVVFKNLGHIRGKGNTASFTKYHFTHINPEKGTNYYRLKQVDFNESYTYSPVEVVNIGRTAKSFVIIPTVATTNVRIELFGLDHKDYTELHILDAMGRKLYAETSTALDAMQINVEQLQAGSYFMQVKNGNTVLMQRFVKSNH